VGQDLKFVKHISTTNVPTWEIYAKPAVPKETPLEKWEKQCRMLEGKR